MKKAAVLIALFMVFVACEPSIVPGEKIEGTITFSDNAKESNATEQTYYSDTYRLAGSVGDGYRVELWADEDARMVLEQVREEGYYPDDICSTSGEGYDEGEASLLFDGTNYFNVYLIDQDMTEDGVAYSFLFTEL